MGSVGNSNQWQPYAYKDCSLEICSIYCPQWCYIIFPPPPPFGYGNNGDSSTDFSPLIIAIIGILASAFILVSYYTIISKYCRNRATTAAANSAVDMEDEENLSQIRHENHLQAHPPPAPGLDEALIKSITVCKYKRGDGLVEGTDCSVCLSEFQEHENLRLLPKCNHAFHLPCIDTWLKSHSTCPLCRSNISPTNLFPPPTQEIQRTEHLVSSALQYQHRSNDTVVVVVVQDLQDLTVRQESAVLGIENDDDDDDASSKNQWQSFASDSQDSEPDIGQSFRRSVSLNSLSWQGRVSVADILRASQDSEEDEEEDELQMGIGSSKVFVQEHCHSNYKTGVSNLGMNRSISTGKLGFSTHCGKGKSCIIPS